MTKIKVGHAMLLMEEERGQLRADVTPGDNDWSALCEELWDDPEMAAMSQRINEEVLRASAAWDQAGSVTT